MRDAKPPRQLSRPCACFSLSLSLFVGVSTDRATILAASPAFIAGWFPVQSADWLIRERSRLVYISQKEREREREGGSSPFIFLFFPFSSCFAFCLLRERPIRDSARRFPSAVPLLLLKQRWHPFRPRSLDLGIFLFFFLIFLPFFCCGHRVCSPSSR